MTSLVPLPSPVLPTIPSPPVIISTASPPVPTVTISTASPPPSPTPNSTALTPPVSNLTASPPSAFSNESTSGSLLPPPSSPPNKLPPGALAGLIVGIALGAIMVLIGGGVFFILYRKRKRKEAESHLGGRPHQGPKDDYSTSRPNYHLPTDNDVISLPKPTPPPGIFPMLYQSHQPSRYGSLGSEEPFALPSPGIHGFSQGTFTYEELATATNGFSDANLIGQGGFGYVHKGVLSDGRVVAVKQLKAGSGQGEREFQAEIEVINRVNHQHLVSLFGYCIAGAQRMLVYDFISNQTLEFHLHGKGRPTMKWSTRMKIAIGSAKGLAYLHEDCQPKIIHRDIKASNILLDDSFEAKVADFGLAKNSMENDTHVSTRVMGTFGYLAPEYASSGKLTEKSDVFSFGVVLLELITGRRPVDRTQSFLDDSIVEWARPLLKQALEDGIYGPLVDPKLEDCDSSELTRMIACAAACIRHSARLRPRMSQVVGALEGSIPLDDLSDGITPGDSTVFSSYGSIDYNSIQYKEDLKKFRKIALESQEHGSSEYSVATSEFGMQPSGSSTEGQQTTQEMELQRK